ncbi:MAG: hypothetical protein ABH849_02315 [Nanoarchaeota archaeon]
MICLKKLGILLVLFLFIVNIVSAYSIMPSFVVDSNNNAQVAWFDSSSEGIYYSRHSGSDGSALMDPELIVEGGAETPWVDVDSNGDAHIVFTDYRTVEGWATFYVKVDGSTGEVIREMMIEEGPGGYSFRTTSVAVDANGDAHILAHNYYTGKLYYYKIDGNSGAKLVNRKLINTGTYTSPDQYADLAIDSNGDVHAVWGDYYNDPLMKYFKLDGINGNVLITQKVLYNGVGDGYASYPAIAVDPDDNVHIVWAYRRFDSPSVDLTSYIKVDGTTGIPIIPRMEVNFSYTNYHYRDYVPDVAVDFEGNVHIATRFKYDYGDPWIRYIKMDGDTAEDIIPEFRVTDVTADPYVGVLDVDSVGDVHIVYQDDNITGGDSFLVYTKLSGTDGSVIFGDQPIGDVGTGIPECDLGLEYVVQCGEVFNPDCFANDWACCSDDPGEYLIEENGVKRCCNNPNDRINVQGNCVMPTSKIKKTAMPRFSPQEGYSWLLPFGILIVISVLIYFFTVKKK